MSLIKLAIASNLFENPKDPRLLPMTERLKPEMTKKPNKTVMNWGMKK
jgi:hypothetical protein